MKKYLQILFLAFLPLQLSAQSENALSFDNIDDYVNAPAASPLIAGSNAISIAFWVLPQNAAPTYPDYDGFAGFRNNVDADFYIIQLSSTGIEARFRNSNGIAYDVVYNGLLPSTPQHFALTYDGSALTLYHDGVFAGQTLASGSITNNSGSFYIGMLPWTSEEFYMSGRIDEVSLWNKSLSVSEISCIKSGSVNPSDPNLQLYYKFNQGIGAGNNTGITSLLDSKGNINGVLNGFALTGNTSNFVTGAQLPNSSNISAVLCPGDVYVLGTQTLTVPGIYYEAFPVSASCDSVVQLFLTSPVINTAVSQVGPTLTSQQSGASYQWIDCQNGNAPITGETSQSFTATSNGSYAVVVAVGGCADTSNCINVTNVGIANLNNSLIQVSPNPFSDELNIKNTHPSADLNISIRDLAGRTIDNYHIIAGNPIRISTSQWPAGTYLVTDEQNGIRVRCVKY